MAAIRKSGSGVAIEMNSTEKQALLSIVEELSGQLGDGALTKFRSYDDAAMEAEYQNWTMPAVATSRANDVDIVRTGLNDARTPIELDELHTWSWARGLNHLRLAAASNLRTERHGDFIEIASAQEEKSHHRMLTALGWIQESLIGALDS